MKLDPHIRHDAVLSVLPNLTYEVEQMKTYQSRFCSIYKILTLGYRVWLLLSGDHFIDYWFARNYKIKTK